MSPKELERIIVALEGIERELKRINDEGMVIINDAGINEN